MSIVGLSILYFSGQGDVTQFFIGISIVGICFGSFMGVYPGLTARQFGPKNNSVNYGIMFIGFAVAGYIGPNVLNNIFASTGSYQNAFLVAMAVSLFGLVLTFVYTGMNNKLNATSEAKAS